MSLWETFIVWMFSWHLRSHIDQDLLQFLVWGEGVKHHRTTDIKVWLDMNWMNVLHTKRHVLHVYLCESHYQCVIYTSVCWTHDWEMCVQTRSSSSAVLHKSIQTLPRITFKLRLTRCRSRVRVMCRESHSYRGLRVIKHDGTWIQPQTMMSHPQKHDALYSVGQLGDYTHWGGWSLF